MSKVTIWLNNFHEETDKSFFSTDTEDTEEEMSDSSAIQQQNDGPQSSGGRIRSKHPTDCQRGNYDADSEDSSKPTGKWSVSKSKVNCYKFTFHEFLLICWLFQEKEITTGMWDVYSGGSRLERNNV